LGSKYTYSMYIILASARHVCPAAVRSPARPGDLLL